MYKDPIELVKSPEELDSFLYKEKIDELKHLAGKGVRWAKAELVGELGEREFDNLPEYDSGCERGSNYENN